MFFCHQSVLCLIFVTYAISLTYMYHLSHKGSPKILEWVVYLFSRGSSWPGLKPGSTAVQVDRCWFNSWVGKIPWRGIGYPFQYSWASLVAQTVKNLPAVLPAVWETWVQSLGWEDPLEEGMVTHSSILAWKIPWRQKPGGLQSVGLQRVGHNWATKHSTHFILFSSLLFPLPSFLPSFRSHLITYLLYM